MSTLPAYPDASVLGNKQPSPGDLFFDVVFTGRNVNTALKGAVAQGVKLIPEVGALISGLVTALWPNPSGDKQLVFKDIESKVAAVAAGLIEQNDSLQMRSRTEGLYNVLQLYMDEEPKTPAKGQYFTSLLTHLAASQPYYFNDQSPWNNLPYFVSMGTLHITALRERHLFYSIIYGIDDAKATVHQKQLEDTIRQYLTARNRIVKKCIDWHRSKITIDYEEKNSGYFNSNKLRYKDPVRNVDEYFSWSQNDNFTGAKEFACRQRQFQSWVDTGYRAQIEALLSPSFAWPLYHPTPRGGLADENPAQVDEGQVSDTTVRRLMFDYPGWICDGAKQTMGTDPPFYFDHSEFYHKNGPITKIVVRSGDRIDGIQVWYGNQETMLQGKDSGKPQVLELKSDEMITGLFANEFDTRWGVLGDLMLQATTETGEVKQTLKAGKPDGKWKYSFDGHFGGLQKEETKRLLWFTGFSLADGLGGWIFRLQPVFGHYQTWGPLK